MKIPIAKQSFNNVHSSEIYRAMEREAVKKGFFDPSPEEIVRLAAEQTDFIRESSVIDAKSTGDLFADVSKLVDGLKRRGYVVQAEEISNNLLMYKQAECALYNLKMETNQEYTDLAHPEGNADIVDAGELGEIETQQSMADKILAVVRKTPTGKLASLAETVVKLAQDVGPAVIAFGNIQAKLKAFPKLDVDKVSFTTISTTIATSTAYVEMAEANSIKGVSLPAISSYERMTEYLNKIVGDSKNSNSFVDFVNNNIKTDTAKVIELATACKHPNPSVFAKTSYSLVKVLPSNSNVEIIPGIPTTVVDQGAGPMPLAAIKAIYKDNSAKIDSFASSLKEDIYSIWILVIDGNFTTSYLEPNPITLSQDTQGIWSSYVTNYAEPVFGKENQIWNTVNASIKTFANEISDEIYSLATSVKTPDSEDYKKQIEYLNSIKSTFDNILSKAKGKALIDTLAILSATETAKINSWRKELSDIFDKSETDILEEGGVETIDTKNMLAATDEAIMAWRTNLKTTKDKRKAMNNISTLKNFRKTVRASGKSAEGVRAFLAANKYKNVDDYVSEMKDIANMARQ